MYYLKSDSDCRLTGSLSQINLFLASLAVPVDRGNMFAVGCELAEKGGRNTCSGTTETIVSDLSDSPLRLILDGRRNPAGRSARQASNHFEG